MCVQSSAHPHRHPLPACLPATHSVWVHAAKHIIIYTRVYQIINSPLHLPPLLGHPHQHHIVRSFVVSA